METAKILVYDGSFNGFLTSIFRAFEDKVQIADIRSDALCQNGLFSETETVFTQMDKAKRVWNGIQAKSNEAIKNIYFAYLSGSTGIELLLYRHIRKMFAAKQAIFSGYTDNLAIKISQLAKNVGREKRHLEASLQFQLSQDGVHFATIEPDFDVLPLISKHFRSRYPDRPWIIYDMKRKYGLYYNLESVEVVSLDLTEIPVHGVGKGDTFLGEAYSDRDLLNDYFGACGIRAHIQYGPLMDYDSKKRSKRFHEKAAV